MVAVAQLRRCVLYLESATKPARPNGGAPGSSMNLARVAVLSNISLFLLTGVACAQSGDTPRRHLAIRGLAPSGCSEAPSEDALVATCIPASSANEAEDLAPPLMPADVALKLPDGTPLRVALDQRVRIDKPGAAVRGKIVETVYAFDEPVIPAGSIVNGRIEQIAPVPAFRRVMAYANGNLTPFRNYKVSFDTVTLPDGKQLPIQTTVSPGTAEVVHLVSNPEKEKQKGLAGQQVDKAKAEAKGRVQEAKAQAHEGWQKLTAPGKMHRLKEFLVTQSPYRHQYLEPGTRFVADLNEPLNFGATKRSAEQLANMGAEPTTDTTLKARLVAEVSSATATRGTPVMAVLTEPLYTPTHQLILPANSRLVGEVLKAKPARKLHHNGELRVVFERIETSDEGVQALAQLEAQAQASDLANLQHGDSQAMVGNLEGLEVAKSSNMKLDEEGGAHTTDSKTRYLSTGLAVLLAAAASHTEVEHGTTETAGPGVRTAAGDSGMRLTGALLSLVAKSMPVSLAFGAYGASSSIYMNFLSRGHDVVLPKDTPMEIGFGPPHKDAAPH